MSGPNLRRAEAEPGNCYKCNRNPGTIPHATPGGQIFLCSTCDTAMKNKPAPPPKPEAGQFGQAMNAVIQLRNQASMGLDAKGAAQQILGICARYKTATPPVPALAYTGNPRGLLDTFVPDPPSQPWKDECLRWLTTPDPEWSAG